MTVLRPFFSYYGGKWSLAPRYPAPLFGSIVEPFAGSAGYSVRHADRQVTLIDSYPAVAATWRYLIRSSSEEILRLPLIEAGQRVADLPACPEAQNLIGWWTSKGVSAPRQTLSAWGRQPEYARQFWGVEIRGRLARQVDRIRHWRVIEGDYRDHPNQEATWFVDPPYQGPPGRRYPRHVIDYADLGEWSKSRSGQVIVCELEGADWLPFAPFTEARSTYGRQKTRCNNREAIWLGGSATAGGRSA